MVWSGLVGGYCTGLYLPAAFSPEMTQQLQEQGMTTEMIAHGAAHLISDLLMIIFI